MTGRANENNASQDEADPNEQMQGGDQTQEEAFLSTINDEVEILKNLVDMSTTMGFSKR